MKRIVPKVSKINFSFFSKFNFRFLLVIFLILIFGFVLAPTGILDGGRNLLFQATKPLTIVSNFTVDRVSIFFRNLLSLGEKTRENQRLIQENLALQSQLAILNETQHENEILKKEMGFLNTKGELKLLPANIIGRSITGYLKTIVIDRGSADGLKTNQAVISQGFLVGTIRDIWEKSAEVILITDSNSLVPVVLQESRGTGLLRGGLGGLAVEEIPLNISIQKGEQVVTSGLGGDIPMGIIVGNVNEVISREGEIFQKVTIKSPIQIYFLEFVFVVQ